MNHNIAKQLNKVSDGMPIVYEWAEMPYTLTGAELNLTPYGDMQHFEPAAEYNVMMPGMVAVEHKQQVKDAYKRGGWESVREYHRSIMKKIKK